MRLYFLRHGEAEDRSESGRDYDRKLTNAGIEQVKRVAIGIAALIPEATAIFTSPLPRAHKTAEIAAEAIGFASDQLYVSQHLASGRFDLDALAEIVAIEPRDARIILVGHEPDFSQTVRALTGATIEMRKAGLAFVDCSSAEYGSGVLRWLLTPKQLELVGEAKG